MSLSEMYLPSRIHFYTRVFVCGDLELFTKEQTDIVIINHILSDLK